MGKRLREIDDIRGIAIIVMILIHTNAYYPSVRAAYLTLEISQFAVVAFIFCSAYLFFRKEPFVSLRHFFSHLFKRVRRLLVPYWLFFAAYTLLVFLKTPGAIAPSYFIKNLTVTGGVEFNWLVLLFIELTVLMPLIYILYRKHVPLYIVYIVVAALSSVLFLFYTPLSWFRSIMWLPWSLAVAYAIHMDSIKNNVRIFVIVTVLFFVLYVASGYLVLNPLHHPLRMYGNKYPPNMYHLAYSFFAVNILYFLAHKGVFRPFEKVIHFYSVNSYPIFFIHVLVIYFLTAFVRMQVNWMVFFLVTIGMTTVIQILLNKVTAFLRYKGGRQSGYLREPAG